MIRRTPLNLSAGNARYRAMIGTGGIGSGIFFGLDGDHTLGREESRSGHLLDRRDYCKLHIVAHYVRRLLGASFPVIAAGMVGADAAGEALLGEMADAGLDLRYVGKAEGRRTLLSVCLIYPDGAGCNVTENDSACAQVDGDWIARAGPEFERFAGAGIAVALPEVPLGARRALLALGTAHRFLRVASFTTSEIRELGGRLPDSDLLALNLDEAAALAELAGIAGLGEEEGRPDRVVEAALAITKGPAMVTVTAGAQGSWSWDGADLRHLPALPVRVASTAGAGDAHLAGAIAGLAAGLPLAEAHQLGALAGAVAVTSPHTINDELDRDSLRECAEAARASLADRVWALLAPDQGEPH